MSEGWRGGRGIKGSRGIKEVSEGVERKEGEGTKEGSEERRKGRIRKIYMEEEKMEGVDEGKWGRKAKM